MKIKLGKYVGALTLAVSLIAASGSVLAHGGHGGGWHGGGGYHHGGGWRGHRGWNGGWRGGVYVGFPYGGYYGYRQCSWIRGHYNGWGYWVSGRRVCWY